MKSVFSASSHLSDQLVIDLGNGGMSDEFVLLNELQPGRPVTLMQSRDNLELHVIKYALSHDAEAIDTLRREYEALRILSPSGSVPEILEPFEERGKTFRFVMPFIYADRSVVYSSPEAAAPVAVSLASLHSVTRNIPYPPFGFEVPILVGGHAFWIGADKIIQKMCEQPETGPVGEVVREVIELLRGARSTLTRPFSMNEMVLIHGDISTENIILARRGGRISPVFLDFGEAVLGPPQHDLARYAVSANLDPTGTALLLSVYLNTLDEKSRQTDRFIEGFNALKCLAIFDLKILGPLIFMRSGPNSGEFTGHVKAAAGEIRELLRQMKDPE
jgi:aminoglycoside phosphotransferase (APT) family kinase protein